MNEKKKTQGEEVEYFSLKIQGKGTELQVAERSIKPL